MNNRLSTKKLPQYYRRAYWHDYLSPCIYMLTFRKNPLIPPFCNITASADNQPLIEPLTGSKAIDDAISAFTAQNPDISVLRYVVMPDHIHLLIYVTKPLQQPFGTMVAALKGSCSQTLWSYCRDSDIARNKVSMFERNYHDRIVKERGQLDTLTRYILDNPRRYLIKKRLPDLFTQRRFITIGENRFCAYGNIFLLRELDKDAVIIRSHYTPDELEGYRRRWLCIAENGGVLVSPFISVKERAMRDEILEIGGRVIEILDNGLPERYKPAGRFFDYCARGQMLFIAPLKYEMERIQLTREAAWRMNNIAKTICSIAPSTWLSLK